MKNKIKLETADKNCSVVLFRQVKNCAEIKKKLLKGEIDATILNAALVVPNHLQLFVAANKACLNEKRGKMLTKTVHTEVLYYLSPTRKVSESLKMFGIDEQVTDLVVLVFEEDGEDKISNIKELIQGDMKEFGELGQVTDWDKVAKMNGMDSDTKHEVLCDYMISRSASKDLLL